MKQTQVDSSVAFPLFAGRHRVLCHLVCHTNWLSFLDGNNPNFGYDYNFKSPLGRVIDIGFCMFLTLASLAVTSISKSVFDNKKAVVSEEQDIVDKNSSTSASLHNLGARLLITGGKGAEAGLKFSYLGRMP
ncbi:hypothetical protein Tco_0064489 [Tanacetum coccineum]